MKSMENLSYKFCPFCRADLSEHRAGIKFCPFCGENIGTGDVVTQPLAGTEDEFDVIEVKTLDDVIKCYEHFVQAKRSQGMPEPQILLEAEALVKKLKSKVDLKFKAISSPPIRPGVESREVDYYSVVLKACPRRESLARKLEVLLERGYFAIRLAMDTIPSLVIYKGKVDKKNSIIRVFKEEKAAITVIPGNFDANPRVEDFFPDWDKVDITMQELLKAVPVKLWMGDIIAGAVYGTMHGGRDKGVLVITDQALYFLFKHKEEDICRWEVMPYYLIKEISMDTEDLEIIYKDATEEFIAIEDRQDLAQSYYNIQQGMRKGNDPFL